MSGELNKYRSELATLGKEEFFQTYSDAFFYCKHAPQDSLKETQKPNASQNFDATIIKEAAKIRARDAVHALIPIKQKGTFSFQYSVGRAKNCDIFVPAREISKVHAYVRKSEGKYQLSDNDSTNGTYLNDEQLTPGEWQPLNDKDQVRFSGIEFTFYQGEGLVGFLMDPDSL